MNHFEKVAVLMGGTSAERDVSLNSGNSVLNALLSQGINAEAVDVDRDICKRLENGKYSHVFNMLHGRGGEDGVIQGVLDLLEVPYTGSGVLGSALTMDKLRCKQLWEGVGLPTPACYVLNNKEDCRQAMEELSLPLMIKPVLEGSSIGISKVQRVEEMIPAWEAASNCGGTVIAEKFIEGNEYTAAILGEQVLPMIQLKTDNEFYDYQAKYVSNDTQYICPCGLSAEKESELAEIMMESFKAVNAEGWGRVDFMLDEDLQPWLIEVNTVPGMTDHSLVPMAAMQAGISFEALVVKILEGALIHG